MSIKKRTPGSALERGQFIRTCADPSTLAHHPENREMVASMYRRFRFERVMELKFNAVSKKHEPWKPTEEWVIIGRRGQAFEWGVGRLGITIVSARRIQPLLRDIKTDPEYWLKSQQIGDDEANFSCDWTEENIDRANKLVVFMTRRFGQRVGRPSWLPPTPR